MNKYVTHIWAIALVSAIAFTSCKKDDDKRVAVSGVTLEPTSLSLEVGDVEPLTATVHPDNATNRKVIWTSSNKDVATVDDDGHVTALAIGSAKITVTTQD